MNHDDLYGPANRAARLLFLEQRDVVISSQLHELTRQRVKNREEATRLRLSLTGDEAREYDTLKLEAMV
jgi:hypothetical protein